MGGGEPVENAQPSGRTPVEGKKGGRGLERGLLKEADTE